jgi:hypothetical protein
VPVSEGTPPASTNGRSWRLFDDDPRLLDRFGPLFVITGAAVVTLSLVNMGTGESDLTGDIGAAIVTLFVSVTLLLALRSSGVGLRYRRLASVLIGIGIIATFVAILLDLLGRGAAASSEFNPPTQWVILSVIAPVAVVRRVLLHKKTTIQTLIGAVTAYLLMAMAFALIFLSLDGTHGSFFFGTEQPTTSFMYFSLVTITTTGYGDLAAAAPIGRMLATFEAVIGQVYLVTFVAMIVGRLVEEQARAGID